MRDMGAWVFDNLREVPLHELRTVYRMLLGESVDDADEERAEVAAMTLENLRKYPMDVLTATFHTQAHRAGRFRKREQRRLFRRKLAIVAAIFGIPVYLDHVSPEAAQDLKEAAVPPLCVNFVAGEREG